MERDTQRRIEEEGKGAPQAREGNVEGHGAGRMVALRERGGGRGVWIEG